MSFALSKHWPLMIVAGLLLIGGGRKVMTSKDAAQNEAKYTPAIAAAERAHGLPAGLLHRLLRTESSFLTDVITGTRRSAAGAVGIAQFMPGTARQMGVNPRDPLQSIAGAARYLAALYKQTGNWPQAVAAYNWGIGRVLKARKERGAGWLAVAPIETKNYVSKVLA